MKSMRESLMEVHKNMSHPDGTYVSITLNKESQNKLDNWASLNKISNPSDPSEYHTTLIYSSVGIPDVKKYDLNLPIVTRISGWKIFPTKTGQKCLVGVVDSQEIKDHHDKIMKKYGAKYDFPEYIPHVTLSYDYDGEEVPESVPDFNITYDNKEIKPLDTSFIPPKKGE